MFWKQPAHDFPSYEPVILLSSRTVNVKQTTCSRFPIQVPSPDSLTLTFFDFINSLSGGDTCKRCSIRTFNRSSKDCCTPSMSFGNGLMFQSLLRSLIRSLILYCLGNCLHNWAISWYATSETLYESFTKSIMSSKSRSLVCTSLLSLNSSSTFSSSICSTCFVDLFSTCMLMGVYPSSSNHPREALQELLLASLLSNS